ncbi:hypothetical protein V7S57_17200 [Caulobacter sp. CCNWLY153]|jgi:hypothetical protein|uniref:hypothetical protein n=1 Tax=unclassified Caulobacter TaxID=2648921 RepID=UPI002FF40990
MCQDLARPEPCAAAPLRVTLPQLIGCGLGLVLGVAADWANGAGALLSGLCTRSGGYGPAFWAVCDLGHLGMIAGALAGCCTGLARIRLWRAEAAARNRALLASGLAFGGMLLAMAGLGALPAWGGESLGATVAAMLAAMVAGHGLGLLAQGWISSGARRARHGGRA